MRRLPVVLAILALAAAGAAVALIVFEASVGGEEASGPLDDALGFLPASAPFVAAVSTDTEGEQYRDLDSALGRFPFGGQVRDELRTMLEREDIDFERDLKPLLGNDLVVGATEVRVLRGARDLVAALSVKNRRRLLEFVRKRRYRPVARLGDAGELFVKGRRFLLVRGNVLVLARSRQRLEAALAQREEGDRLTAARFGTAQAGLPARPLVRLYGDPQTLIEASPHRDQLRRSRWNAALRTMGATLSVEGDEAVTVDFVLRTENDELSDADLPLPSGLESPFLAAGNQHLVVGTRGVERLIGYLRRAAPAGRRLARLLVAKRQLERRLRTDVDREVIGRFRGSAVLRLDRDGGLGFRSQLSEPAALERRLRRAAGRLPKVREGSGAGRVRVGPAGGPGSFYRLATPAGDFVFGVEQGVFVLDDDPRSARVLASESAAPVVGRQGSLVLRANAESLANRLIAGSAGGLTPLGAPFFTAPLGALTGSARMSVEGMRGRLRLEIE
jgi:Protein of unknown function (DUF3352)